MALPSNIDGGAIHKFQKINPYSGEKSDFPRRRG